MAIVLGGGIGPAAVAGLSGVDGLGIHFLHVRSPEPDAFPLVLTHGYGWSDKPSTTGWGIGRIARAWDAVMVSLGYERYGAPGGDWGSAVSGTLGEVAPGRVAGVHLNTGSVALGTVDDPTPAERASLETETEFRRTGQGCSGQQSTRPQTLGYGLTSEQWGIIEATVVAGPRPPGTELADRFAADPHWPPR